jgi:hypothetical protein
MKKLFSVLILVIIITSCALAKQDGLSYGPKFALNFASEGGDNSGYYKSSTKFGIGGFVIYDLADPFVLQGELLYNRKGSDVTAYNPTVSITGSYIDIVALAKYNIQIDGTIKPSVFAGPSLGILLSANYVQGGTTTDLTSNASGADFGLVFGAGAMYKMGNGDLLFDLRYYLGMSNVNKNSPPSNTNQVFSINVGYAFM